MKSASFAFAFALGVTTMVAACSSRSATPAAAPEPAVVGQDTMAHADGQPCESSDQCQSGACEGTCEPGGGTCAPSNRGCTRDLVQYCGCDGTTFESSGSCPGQRVASAGACPE